MNKALPLLALAALGASAAAQSSFDLVLVVDAGTQSIKRFDPETGTYFGEFGAGYFTNIKDIQLDPLTPGTLLAVDNHDPTARYSSIHRFNFFTGQYLGTTYTTNNFNLTGLATAMGEWFQADNAPGIGTLRQFNPSTGSSMSQLSQSIGSVLADVESKSSVAEVFVSDTVNNIVRDYNTNGAGFAADFTYNITAPRGIGIAQDTEDGYYYAASGTNSVNRFGSGTVFPTRTITTLGTTFDVGFGHSMGYVTGTRAGGGGRIARFNPVSELTPGFFGDDYLVNPTYIQVYTAPEPATLLALGLPALALLRRRRK